MTISHHIIDRMLWSGIGGGVCACVCGGEGGGEWGGGVAKRKRGS